MELLVTVVLLFLVPLNYMAIKQDMICQTYITTEVSYLVDSVRNLGYVTDQMYTTFLRKLEATNQVYDVELIHYKRVIDPIIEEDAVVWNECNYYCTYTEDILNQLYMENNMDDSVNCYRLNQGDYFTMKVSNKNKTFAVRLQEFFLNRSISAKQIMVVYGGAIRDEAY
jgi:hypothetical protein